MADDPDLVTSFANPTVKRFRSLAMRKNRRAHGTFTVEGLQPVWYATRAGWPIDTLIVAPELMTHGPAVDLVAKYAEQGTRTVRVSAAVFAHLSDRDGPSGLAAIVVGHIPAIGEFSPTVGRPVIALYRAGNPGNIGTIIRSADAAGAAGVLLVGDAADPLAPQAIKAAMGSLFFLPVAHTTDVASLLEWATGAGRSVWGVTGAGATDLWSTALAPDSVLLFGSEGDGLPGDVAAQCAGTVAIAMEGSAESLNLAAAVSVTAFELARRRAGAAG